MNTKRLIGLRIKELRRKRGLTQEEVAAQADITAKHLSSIELGKENPTLDTFLKLSSVLKVELWELLNYGHEIKRKELQAKLTTRLKSLKEEELKLVYKFMNTIGD